MKHKRLLAVAAFVVGILIAGMFIVVPMLVRPESYRGLLQQELAVALKGRAVELGPISLDFWPGIGLEVTNFEVADLAPGAPFISSGKLVVRAAFWPLLSRKLVVRRIELDQPALRVVKLSPDKWNFSDLAEPSTKEPGAPKGELTIRTLVITDATLELSDNTGAIAPLRVDLKQLTLDEVYTDKPMKAVMDASVANAPGAFHLDAVYGPLSAPAAERKTELTLAFDKLDLKAFLAILPVGKLPIVIRNGVVTGSIAARPTADLNILDADIKLVAGGFSYINPDATWPVSEPADIDISGHARYDREKKTTTLDDGVITALGNRVAVSLRNEPTTGTVPGSTAAPSVTTLKLRVDNGNLDNLLRLAPVAGKPLASSGLKITGPADLGLDYRGVTGAPAVLDASIDLSAAAFAIPGSIEKPAGSPGGLSSHVVLGEKTINLSATVVRLGPLTLNGGGTIGRDPLTTSSIRLEGGPADSEALRAMFPSLKGYELGGQMSVGVEVSGPLSKKESLLIRVFRLDQRSEIASFSATASVRLTKPMQVDFTLDSDHLNLDRVLKPTPPSPKKESSLGNYAITGRLALAKVLYKQTDMSAVSGNLALRAARLSIPDLKANLLGGSISGPVSLDLGREPLSGSVSANLGGFMVDAMMKKFTSFPVVLSGEATGNVSVAFAGTDAAAISKTAKGNGKVKLNNGELQGVDLVNGLIEQWAASKEVKQIVRENLSSVIKRNVGERTPFKDLSAELDLATGKIKLNRAAIDISEGEIEATGVVGLDRSVDLKGRTKLSKEISQQLLAQVRPWIEKQSGGQLSGDVIDLLLEDGRLILPFTMKGAWPKPTLLFDAQGYGAMVQKNIKKMSPEQLLETVVGKEKKDELMKEAEQQINQAAGEIGKQTEKAIGKDAAEMLRGIIPGFPAAPPEEPKAPKAPKPKPAPVAGSTTAPAPVAGSTVKKKKTPATTAPVAGSTVTAPTPLPGATVNPKKKKKQPAETTAPVAPAPSAPAPAPAPKPEPAPPPPPPPPPPAPEPAPAPVAPTPTPGATQP